MLLIAETKLAKGKMYTDYKILTNDLCYTILTTKKLTIWKIKSSYVIFLCHPSLVSPYIKGFP